MTSAASSAYEALVTLPELVLARRGNVLLQSWRRRVTADAVLAGAAATERLLASLPASQFIVTLGVSDTAVALPDERARAVSVEVLKKTIGRHRGIGTVLEGTGFAASAARAALTGIMMLSRNAVPQRTFASIDEAVPWVLERADNPALDARTLSAVVRAVREEHK